MFDDFITLSNTVIIPDETPFSDVCVVSTVDFPNMSPDLRSNATALVKVPPTSMPTRTLFFSFINFS